tara:strand:- start:1287 stop:2228 length:942 start_codon:yes stop_codon:yes gene_type:complete
MDYPLISIILRTYKRSNKLEKCIENIIRQKYKNWELIIVDDNGIKSKYSGEAKKIIQKFKKINNPIWIIEHNENLGLCAAGNTGIEKANGEFIAFIDDDDEWEENKLFLQINPMLKNKNIGIVFCGLRYIDLTRKNNKRIIFNLEENLFLGILKKGSGICTSALLFRKEVLLKINGFDRNKLSSYTDFDLLLRASQITNHVEIREPLVNYYVDYEGISRNYKAKYEGKKIVLKRYKDYFIKFNLEKYFGSHLEVLADYALLIDKRLGAIKYYTASLCMDPFVVKRYFKIIISILGGRKLYIFLLDKFSEKKFF